MKPLRGSERGRRNMTGKEGADTGCVDHINANGGAQRPRRSGLSCRALETPTVEAVQQAHRDGAEAGLLGRGVAKGAPSRVASQCASDCSSSTMWSTISISPAK